MSTSGRGSGAAAPSGLPVPAIVLSVVGGALALTGAFELGRWSEREARVPAATRASPSAPAAPRLAPEVPPATPQPVEAIAPAMVGDGRAHALLVRPGMRFQTIASDTLAVHGPVTVEMWVRIVEPGGGVVEVRLHNFAFWLHGQRVTFLVQSAHTVDSPDLGVGEWRHVAGTFDGARLRLYIDGAEVANAGGSLAGNSLGVLASLQIVHHDRPGPTFAIDDVRVLAYPRSQEEIRADMRGAPPVEDPGLLAAWSFDEGRGQQVRDAGRHALHGWLGADPTRPDRADAVWIDDTPSSRPAHSSQGY